MHQIQSEVHIQENDLQLYTQGRLEPQRSSLAEAHLSACETCRQLLAEFLGHRLAPHPAPALPGAPALHATLGLHAAKVTEPSVSQKRTEPRFTTDGEATVQELHPISFDRQVVKIVNVSKNGLGIVGSKAILPGTIVQLRMNGTVELGNVRYCSAVDGGGFRIGLRLSGEE